jgi:hypothetical protein
MKYKSTYLASLVLSLVALFAVIYPSAKGKAHQGNAAEVREALDQLRV